MPPPRRARLNDRTESRKRFDSPKKGGSHSSQKRLKRAANDHPVSMAKKAKRSQTNQEQHFDRSESPGFVPCISGSPHGGKTAHAEDDQRAAQGQGRRTHRYARDSNGVDLLGSPYPKTMHVPKQATALEVFSQQTGLSSDRPSVSDDRESPGPLILAPLSTARSSTELRHISSNNKTRSSAGQEASKTLVRVASGPLTQRLLKASSSITATANPFLTSHTQKSTTAGPISELAEKLRQRGFTSADDHMENNQSLTEDDDPDKSFVDDRDDGIKDITSSPASSKASASSTARDGEKIIEDIGDWRNTLKPHQTRLFDSLVIASHKLVRHMVDKDTAGRDIVADYRSRGEIIVAELQQAHTMEYEQYLSRMQVWKQQAADKLDAYAKELGKRAKDSERAKIEQQKAKRSWTEVQSAFSKLLEG